MWFFHWIAEYINENEFSFETNESTNYSSLINPTKSWIKIVNGQYT